LQDRPQTKHQAWYREKEKFTSQAATTRELLWIHPGGILEIPIATAEKKKTFFLWWLHAREEATGVCAYQAFK